MTSLETRLRLPVLGVIPFARDPLDERTEDLAGLQRRFRNLFPVDVGAVDTAQILDEEMVLVVENDRQ